ncbi:MAG: DUF1624 domain-containing protein [Bacteroidetes bacterium]|nr:DUF1624 domain-containing protein [Bacteroidota bacterium]
MNNTAPAAPVQKRRIESIDMLRGLIMVIMAIDHVRDYFHPAIAANDPTNMITTTPILFFTRFITHYCAPLFVFLSGISAQLAGGRRTKKQLSAFLIKRGLWVVAVELVFIRFAFSMDPLHRVLPLQVIWAIGASMIILGIWIWLPMPVIAATGVVLVFGHDILDYLPLPKTGTDGLIWKLLLTGHREFFHMTGPVFIKTNYAVLPWAGVMMLGYVFGLMYKSTFAAAKRRRILTAGGLFLLALFFVLRTFNIYGDPAPWTAQGTMTLNILSFLNVSKYPPSLLYLCVTLGPGLLLLALMEKVKNKLTDIFIVFGNVPFLYYIMHWFLLRAFSVAEFYLSGYGAKDMYNPKTMFFFRPDTMGYSLGLVYVVWFAVIVILYFPCRAFARYKRSHQQWWLSYL